MVKVRTSFTLKQENLDLLKDNQGIATKSAFLDFIIAEYFSKMRGSQK